MGSGVAPGSGRGRRGRRRVAAALVALVVAVSLPLTQAAARADDDRDAAASRQKQSASHVAQIKDELSGIDSTLAQVYLDLDALKSKIPVAQSQLDVAEATYTAASREHEVAEDQLESATAERDRIEALVSTAEQDKENASETIADLAREMYRGEVASPVMLAMTAQGTEQVADRAAAADALARTQTKALGEAASAEAVQRNQAARQQAVTDRIAALEAKARAAAATAEKAKATAKAKVDELAQLKSQADAKKKEWEGKKAEASKQLDAWQAEYTAATKKLDAIDAANRAKGTVYVRDGGMFSSPLPVALQITSPFGWRLHPVLGIRKYHNGTDFAAGCGTVIHPIAPGVVSAVTVETAGGNVVYVNHGMINGHSWISAYVHQERVNVSVGQRVDRSTVVGWVGATGYATGCHLHLSLMRDGGDVDPMKYL